jgi:tetratricopeptide (TPR) repeat protein
MKRYDEAMSEFNKVIKLRPDYADTYYHRGVVWNRKKSHDKAITDFNKAIELKPDYAEACNALAWLLATCSHARHRDAERAVEMASKAVDLSPKAYVRDTLAAAYAEAGEFDRAIEIQKEVIEMLKETEQAGLLAGAMEHLAFYEAGKPWREE